MRGLAILLGVGLIVAEGLMAWLMMRRLRRPPRKTYAWAVSKGLPGDPKELRPQEGGGGGPREFREWKLRDPARAGREYPVWDIVGDDPAGPVVVFTPGWGDAKVSVLPRLRGLAAVSSRIIAWDPPGHGDAPGLCGLGVREPRLIAELVRKAQERGIAAESTEDTEKRGREVGRKTEERGVVLYGSSLGAGASIVCAAAGVKDARIVGVIAEGVYRWPWTPAFRVMRLSGYPWRVNGPIVFALMGLRMGMGPTWGAAGWRGRGGPFDRAWWAERLGAKGVPLLVLHGTEDEVCPVEDGRAAAEAWRKGFAAEKRRARSGDGDAVGEEADACARMVEIEGGGHNDLWTEEKFAAECGSAVKAFVSAAGRDSAERGPRA